MIPIIDFQLGLCSQDGEIALREALEGDSGFFLLTNIPPDLSALLCNTMSATKDFFMLPSETKMQYISTDRARRGYSPALSENFASLIGQKGDNDNVEKFRIGPAIENSANDEYYTNREGKVHFFPNVPCDLTSRMQSYYAAMESVCGVLTAKIESALNLESGYLTLSKDRHTSILTANCYPHCLHSSHSSGSSMVLISPHSDVSLFTVIAASAPGLEVRLDRDTSPAAAQWVPVPHISDSLVVNIGDCLSTSGVGQGRLRSAVHRVTAVPHPVDAAGTEIEQSPPPRARYSLAFFASPRYDSVLDWQDGDLRVGADYNAWRKARICRAMKVK